MRPVAVDVGLAVHRSLCRSFHPAFLIVPLIHVSQFQSPRHVTSHSDPDLWVWTFDLKRFPVTWINPVPNLSEIEQSARRYCNLNISHLGAVRHHHHHHHHVRVAGEGRCVTPEPWPRRMADRHNVEGSPSLTKSAHSQFCDLRDPYHISVSNLITIGQCAAEIILMI